MFNLIYGEVKEFFMGRTNDIALMSHLMRRAGFGATRDEVERRADVGYEETVEELLDPESQPPVDEYMLYRYLPMTEVAFSHVQGVTHWLYHMIHTKRPLQEKIALFYHHIFATSDSKVNGPNHLLDQIEMFRVKGLGSYRDLLICLAKDPAMIFWLDNNLNNKKSPNENWGRELLELFSIGVGNYTEEDVKECARAFTGWTISPKIPTSPYGRFYWNYTYSPENHDYGIKSFLGEEGQFDGDEVIDIVVKQDACHRFIARHLYNFFVKDEPPVPLWPTVAPNDPEAIQQLANKFVQSKYEIKEVLRFLFNSDFFKKSMFEKVKSPIEVFVNTIKLSGDLQGDYPGIPLVESVAKEPGYMGQSILDPPSVEGWHTGTGWINSGTLGKRINFVVDRFSDTSLPGISNMVAKISENGFSMTQKELVDKCLDLLGPLEIDSKTFVEIQEHAARSGDISWSTPEGYEDLATRIGEIFSLIVSTKEYQMG